MRRSFAGLFGACALVVLATLVLLHSLDQPWLKSRLQALARSTAGVELDYRVARIALLSGVELADLVVRSPLELRGFAPELVRVGRVRVSWSLRSIGSIFLGRAPVIERVAVSDVALTLVVDEHGRTSIDALWPSHASSAPPKALPLSQRASRWLAAELPVGELSVDHVALVLTRTAGGAVLDRTALRGVALALATSPRSRSASGPRLEASFGTASMPLELQLERAGPRGRSDAAKAKLWLTLVATPSTLRAALELRMIEQTFAARVSAERWLHAEASVRFDANAGRTEIVLDRAEAGDGAVIADASIELPDAGDPIVRHARGEVDLARLLRWLPEGLSPASVERARVRFQLDALVAGPVLRLPESGVAALDAEFSNVVIALPTGSLQLREARLSLHAEPLDGGGIAGKGSLRLAAVQLAAGKDPNSDRLAGDDLDLDLDGRQAADGALDARVGLRFARVEALGAAPVWLHDGRLELRVQALYADAAEPLATRGELELSTELGSLELHARDAHVRVGGLTSHAHTLLAGHAPYDGELEVRAARFSASGRDGKAVADTPLRLEVRVRDAAPERVHPTASRGIFHAALDTGTLQAVFDARKTAADAFDFALRANAKTLQPVRPFLPVTLRERAPWDRIGFALRSSGRVERISAAAPVLRETTEIELEQPAFEHVAARSLSINLKSQGNALQHHAELELRAHNLVIDGSGPSDDRVTLSATLDRVQPTLEFRFASEGRASADVSGSLGFDAARRALSYQLEARLGRLAALAPLAAKLRGLDAFDLAQLELELSTRGVLTGVVAAVTRDGDVEFEPSPARSAMLEGTSELHVAHLRFAKGDMLVAAPDLGWHGEMHSQGERRNLDSRLEIGTLHLDLGSRAVDLNGVRDDLSVVLAGNLADPELELTQRLSVRAIEQTLVPEYPLGDLVFTLTAEHGPEGVVHISDMKLANGLAGTGLALQGNLDLGEGRRTLSVSATLAQDLARLSTVPERFTGRGKLELEANVTSPDLALYRVRAALKGENVTLALAREGIELENANGEVPIAVTLELGAHGVTYERSQKRNPYSMLRFADQHPLLARSGFLSIARLKTPFASIAPLVGNLEIDQNVISLRQFELGLRGGNVTGQCGIDWEGANSTLELHVRASGVQSSHGEPFDGNIAVAISAADRTIDGRAEILRIGERHLLDLLELQDPLHSDPAINRIRTALGFGYPKSLRLVFDHGFASAHLELGGLAQFVSIGELRGIPMGPIVDRMLAPMLDGPEMKETP